MNHVDSRPAGAMAAFKQASGLMVRFLDGRGDPSDCDSAIDLLEQAVGSGQLPADVQPSARAALGSLLSLRVLGLPPEALLPGADPLAFAKQPRTGAPLRPGQSRADVRRAIHLLREVRDSAAGTPLADEVRGPLAVMELFAQAPDLDFAGPMFAQVESVLGDAVRKMPESSRRDLMEGLYAVVGDAGDAPALVTALESRIDALPADDPQRPELLAGSVDVLALIAVQGFSTAALDHGLRLARKALDEVADDDPRRADLARRYHGFLVGRAALTADHTSLDEALAAANDLLDGNGPDDPLTRGRNHYLRAIVLALRAGPQNLGVALPDLQRAMELVPASDPLAPYVAMTLGALLHDRSIAEGSLADSEAAAYHFGQAQEALRRQGVTGRDADRLQALTSVSRLVAARRGEPGDLTPVLADLSSIVARFPPGSTMRSRFDGILGLMSLMRGATERNTDEIRAGLGRLSAAAGSSALDATGGHLRSAFDGLETMLSGLLHGDPARVADGSARLTDPSVAAAFSGAQRVSWLEIAAVAHEVRFGETGDPVELDAAISALCDALGRLADDDGNPQVADVLTRLGALYVRRAAESTGTARAADLDRAIAAGLRGLRAHAASALLQDTPAQALVAVEAAAGHAQRVATWCLVAERPTDAVTAVELGRGVVLHAAASATRVAAMLREAGHAALADEWETSGADGAARWPTPGHVPGESLDGAAPDELRRRVLSALRGSPAMRDLLDPPEPAGIAAALRRTGADALAYLLPGDADRPGRILAVDAAGAVVDVPAPGLRITADGPVTRFLAAYGGHLPNASGGRTPAGCPDRDLGRPAGDAGRWSRALGDLCDWAYPAAIVPLLDRLGAIAGGTPRVVLVPGDVLGGVPWHAARIPTTDGYRYACAELVLSSAASARQLIDVTTRRPGADAGADGGAGGDVVLVADPGGGLPGARAEVAALTAVYPGAVVLGAVPGASGPGTPAEVLALLPGPDAPPVRTMHLACHASAAARPDRSFLALTDRLPVTDVLRRAHRRPAGADLVVVLSACTSDVTTGAQDEALTLTTAFLAAGATTVVGSLWPVPDTVTPLLMYVFHHHLAVLGQPPADALRSAQLWMLDPQRRNPPGMPAALTDLAGTADLTAIDAWAAFAHHGR